MVASENRAARRRGRPPDTDSSDTRTALLNGARALFGERGYGAVTNKDLAAAAGVTTGALYHYVESKLDLYIAVHTDMQQQIYRRFQVAEASHHTFIGKLEATLDAARQMNAEDPTLARFVGTVRADLRRYPEVRARLGETQEERDEFFMGIVECGVDTGEIGRDDAVLVREFIRLMMIALTEGPSDSPELHRLSIDAIMGMVRGALVHPPPDRIESG